jgi:hypothetical protein
VNDTEIIAVDAAVVDVDASANGAANDNLDVDAPTPLSSLTPLALIARLSASSQISPDERDAGEYVARLAGFIYSRPAGDGSTHIPIRDAAGLWQNPLLRGQDIKARLEAALGAVRTPSRRKAVTLALVSRDRTHDWTDTSALSCGLEDISRYLWPMSARATTSRAGITLVATDGPQDATPERLTHANDNAVEDGVRRIIDSPFARMHVRGQLDPDAGINDILFSAGRNYYQNWYYSGLGGISGIDYSRVGGGGSDITPSHHMPRSEFALRHRDQFRAARIALGDRYSIVVDPIVLEEKMISDIREDSGYKHVSTASAITVERLNVGLRRLAVYYGLMRRAA